MISPPRNPRILVMRAGQLGDTLFATSIIEPLRQCYGDAVRIDFVLKSGMGQLFAYDSRISRTFELAHRNLPAPLNPGKLRVVAAALRQPYDLLVNLETGTLLNDLVLMIRSTRKEGMPFRKVADDRDGEHAVDHLRRMYEFFLPNRCLAAAEPTLFSPPLADVAEKFNLPSEYLVLNPTNSQFTKRDYRSYRAWPLAYWRELIGSLAARRSESIILVGGQGEQEYFRYLAPLPAGVISLAGRTRLDELSSVLAHAKAVITTDTGPSHLAAAVGAPVFAIFGPSDDRKTGPYPTPKNRVHILSARLSCSPCSLTARITECDLNRCMQEVTPPQVLAALDGILGNSSA